MRFRIKHYAGFAACAALAFCLAGCGPKLPDLETVNHPDLSAVEEVVREQVEEAKEQLARRTRRGTLLEVADAYGALGELYQTYDLAEPAAQCHRNAHTLDPNTYASSYYLGLLARQNGDFASAIKAFQQALDLRPKSPHVRLQLAETALELGQIEDAREHFSALETDEGFAAAAAYGLGRVATATGDAEAAIQHFRTVLELQPGAGNVHHPLAMALQQIGRSEEAEAELAASDAGAVTSPDPLSDRLENLGISSGMFLRRGNRALMAGDPLAAANEFSAGVRTHPNHAELKRNLAIALVRQEDFDQALAVLRQALEQEPENASVHHDLGTVYLAKRMNEPGIEAFRRAVELEPDFEAAHFNLANALAASDRWSEVSEPIQRVLEIDPGNSRARYLGAMALHKQGKNPEAVQRLEALLREEPTNVVARQGLANIFAVTRRHQRALQLYRQGLDLDLDIADRGQLLSTAARLAWKHQQQDQAIAFWRQAVELQPESSQTHTDLANGLQLTGERTEARIEFAKAVELDPSNAIAWLSETSLWILDSDFRTAHERLEAALAAHPNHPALSHTMARLLATCPVPELRDGDRALQLARAAYAAEAALEHAETVAMALAEMGRFEQAIQFQRGLVQQAQMQGDQQILRRLVGYLRLYENRQPARATSAAS